ncbi:MAG TPA: alkyl sulfatase dimerization domain-containing protein [Caldimonas sp.]|nr:alkyl sulfatase dimerization domain-containing protein [Caldimonas sp.]
MGQRRKQQGFTIGLALALASWLAPGGARAQPVPPDPPTPFTAAANAAWLERLPFADRADFEAASRGLIAPVAGPVAGPGGRPVWNPRAYDFEQGAAPPSVNPSLWRQAQLNAIAGLFKVADRIYQVRGLDISNMTILEGDTGLVVIDPLLSAETARAALDLYLANRPRRPVVAVIYTHSHVDHFGGVRGVIDAADVAAGKVQVIAPAGFMEEAVSENVIAGNAMSRRAQYMYGAFLPRGPLGQVDAGLGKAVAAGGTLTLVAPTRSIERDGEAMRIDGIEIEFQLTPGTEAPAEMNLWFPRWNALCAAENATHTMHNILTLRGAPVRDARAWSQYLDTTLARYGTRADVLFAQHHWPTWGNAAVQEFLADQRDMYRYVHDQTLRLLNKGLKPLEIAAALPSLPPGLAGKWYARDYYGSMSHNVRAVYQRYLGWYDGNPATLDPLPQAESARRLVEAMGGADAVLARARDAYARGEYRWVAQLLNHVVFADPRNSAARTLEAQAFEQLAYQSENATWRNEYLAGAQELRNGVPGGLGGVASPDVVRAIPLELFFDYLGVRLDPARIGSARFTIDWVFTDLNETHAVTLRNQALTHRKGASPKPDATITLTRGTLDAVSLRQTTMQQALQSGAVRIEGHGEAVALLFGALETFEPAFPIVTP